MYQNKIRQYKSDLNTYRMSNMMNASDDDKYTLAAKTEIAKTQAELGQYLNEEV